VSSTILKEVLAFAQQERQAERRAEKQTERQTERQAERQTERQAERQTERHANEGSREESREESRAAETNRGRASSIAVETFYIALTASSRALDSTADENLASSSLLS
jgi:hypothetical protein